MNSIVMESMPVNIVSLIAFFLAMLVALLLIVIRNKLSRKIILLQQQTQNQELLVLELKTLLTEKNIQLSQHQQHYRESQLENEQVAKQLAHRIKTMQEKFDEQLGKIEQLLHQQPEDKLYSRAQKLVELGADITEIMRECDIPRPEAEMLMAVHRQKLKN